MYNKNYSFKIKETGPRLADIRKMRRKQVELLQILNIHPQQVKNIKRFKPINRFNLPKKEACKRLLKQGD